jgi:tRNA-modifying protein YgfZ
MSGEAWSPVSVETGYRAAHEGAVVVDRSRLGLLKLTGEARLDLINRMSTQKVNDLGPGEGAATVLTTDIGRIIDRLILYASSDAVYCLTGEDYGEAIARYLLRFVFFNDDFQVEDLSQETTIFGVYGRRAQAQIQDLFGEGVDMPLHHWRQKELDGQAVYLHRSDPVAGAGYLVMCEEAGGEPVLARLLHAGFVPVDEATFEYLRVESGLPRFGHELTEEYIPLEANLWADVSFNKGCYTGQEVIARMESRGRLAKRLVSLAPGQMVEQGATLTHQGKAAGAITSVADGPRGPRALAYVRTSVLEQQPDILEAGPVQVRLVKAEEGASS